MAAAKESAEDADEKAKADSSNRANGVFTKNTKRQLHHKKSWNESKECAASYQKATCFYHKCGASSHRQNLSFRN